MLAKHVVEEVQRILDMEDSRMELNTKVSMISQTLLSNSLAYKQVLAPSALLTHPMNRGGTMVNAYDVHSKG